MYKNEETKVSHQYLRKVVEFLDEPLCLLGGWGVFYLVNSAFEKEKGYPYLGSRDIDLGFNELDNLNKVMNQLGELGFKIVSFRLFKELHSETLHELSTEEAARTPLHYIFPLYVDLIVSKIDPSTRSKLGFTPIDEPLLKFLFEKKQFRREKQLFGKIIFIPSPSLLLAMKITSISGRDKEHKKIKDFCDLVALCLYSDLGIEKLKEELSVLIDKSKVQKSIACLTSEEINKVSQLLNIHYDIIFELLHKLQR